jgi:pre-mRNA-splicing factor 38B
MRISVGEYVEMLLKEYDYYGTRLPRIPVTIERDLKMKLIMIPEKRKRKKENSNNLSKFIPETICRAISSQDNEWHNAKILEVLGTKCCRVFFTVGKEISFEKTDNKCKFSSKI